MNYFSYFSEIEDTFIRRRGKHLMLSPMDWALIESWKERGVPLHVAIRGIEHAFDSYEAKKRKRSVKTLLYCEEEVEAQYAEWLESRVGSHEEPSDAKVEDGDEKTPFPRPKVLAHLQESLAQLSRLATSQNEEETFCLGHEQDAGGGDQRSGVRYQNPDPDPWQPTPAFGQALTRAVKLLSEIADDYASAAHPDTRKLEESLTGIERSLNGALRASASAGQLEEIEKEIKEQLRPYRSHMEKAVYEQTFDNLLLKRLREHFGVPRLSLFFL